MKIYKKNRKWLVFYTRSRAEKSCEIQIKNMEIEVFLPKCLEIRQWKDRKKELILPLFPNYIFARVDEAERIRVLECNGIVSNLSFNGQLVEMSSRDIDQIDIMQKQPSALEVVTTPLPKLGETITIQQGPMSGLKGEIVDHYGSTHILVRIGSIKQAVKVKLPVKMVAGYA
ncbi:MAG: UpxY family transcription antiterminator [Balneolales bacterium]